MDNLTHSLTGFFLSRAGLNRLTPHATPLLLVAANLPDLDIVTLAAGRLDYFHYHRHLTHAIVSAPLLAAVLAVLLRIAVRKPIPLLGAFLAALIGIASHILLDLTNSYGIRIFLPFSGVWEAWDLNNIYDIWIWSLFGFCLAAPLLSNLVGGEIGAVSRQRYPSRTFPILALFLLLVYDGGRVVLHSRAIATLNSRNYNDAPPLRVAALPHAANPFRWQGIAETGSSYQIFDLDLLTDLSRSFNPTRGETVFKSQPATEIAAVQSTMPFRVLGDFARFPVWRLTPVEKGSQLTLTDLRFPFAAEALFDPSGHLLSSTFRFN